jgi:hypothetical protein
MAEYTENFNLEKQKGNDYVRIEGLNGNFDIIDSEIKKVSDNKVGKEAGKVLSSNDYTTAEKTKLSGIAENANNYVHPTTHSPAIIAQDSNSRFVSDVEKATWNGKASSVNAFFTGTALFDRTGGKNDYTNGNIQLRTTDNTPPLIGFHRAGVTAVALYESGCRLYTTASSDATPRKVLQDNDFIFQTTVPTSLASGVLCFVYE